MHRLRHRERGSVPRARNVGVGMRVMARVVRAMTPRTADDDETG